MKMTQDTARGALVLRWNHVRTAGGEENPAHRRRAPVRSPYEGVINLVADRDAPRPSLTCVMSEHHQAVWRIRACVLGTRNEGHG